MSRARSVERDRAKELWLISGRTRLLKDIASELEVSENIVRKWKSEDKWEENIKGAHLSINSANLNGNASKKNRGAQPNNKNAVGNKGGPPKGSQNNRSHGLREKLYWDTLDEEELELIAQTDYYEQEEQQIIEQLKLLTIRERRLMKSINDYKSKENGLALDSVTKRSLDIQGNIITGKSQKQTEVTTKTTSIFDVIMRLEAELTKVQARKTKCIEALKRIRMDFEKLELLKMKMGVGNDDVLNEAKKILGVIDSAF